MEVIALIVLIVLLAPKIFPLIIAALGVLLVILVPANILANSLITVFTTPKSFLKTALNPRLRVNHALEHATINVLEQHYHMEGLAGLALQNGFRIYGYELPPPEIIYRAAQEGLKRMKDGQRNLAIHARCGTSVLVTQMIFSVIYLLVVFTTLRLPAPQFLVGFIIVNFLTRPLGGFMQKYFTTSPRVKKMEIHGVTVEGKVGNRALSVLRPTSVIVHTKRA